VFKELLEELEEIKISPNIPAPEVVNVAILSKVTFTTVNIKGNNRVRHTVGHKATENITKFFQKLCKAICFIAEHSNVSLY